MLKDFDKFMSQLKETNATLDFYTDFNKIRRNVQNIEISLNMLNFLLGKDDLYSAVKRSEERTSEIQQPVTLLRLLFPTVGRRGGSLALSLQDRSHEAGRRIPGTLQCNGD